FHRPVALGGSPASPRSGERRRRPTGRPVRLLPAVSPIAPLPETTSVDSGTSTPRCARCTTAAPCHRRSPRCDLPSRLARRDSSKSLSGAGDRLPPGERPTVCRRFTESPSRFGTILILGSGGLRLVVQRANYVVMYDRWLAVS